MMKGEYAVLALTLGVMSSTIAFSDEPPGAIDKKPVGTVNASAATAIVRSSPKDARRQAEILHVAMHATLQAVHHRYYREDEGLPLPAAILKTVFAELEMEQHVKLRWLAVDGQAMNSDHKPQGSFENDAVKALKSGKQSFEHVENGIYRRAGSITLTNHCLKCHVPDRKNTENRTAGLIIAIPIEEK